MPHIKIYVHLVFTTKNRQPLLATKDVRQKVWRHILENARNKGIFVEFVNGYKDHCHCLISMGAEQKLTEIVKLIKGESSHWINSNGILKEVLPMEYQQKKFAWQNDYFAVSVSESILDRVRNYIKNQEVHHEKKTFQQEYDAFIKAYGFEKTN